MPTKDQSILDGEQGKTDRKEKEDKSNDEVN